MIASLGVRAQSILLKRLDWSFILNMEYCNCQHGHPHVFQYSKNDVKNVEHHKALNVSDDKTSVRNIIHIIPEQMLTEIKHEVKEENAEGANIGM